jgi:hypothetical protein
MLMKGLPSLVLCVFLTSAATNSIAEPGRPLEQIGVATIVLNEVTGSVSGSTRAITTRNGIFEQDMIETSGRSAVRVAFADGSLLTLGPASRALIERFAFDPKAGHGTLSIWVATGVFEFASGKMNKDGYNIRTPFATVALHGTRFGADVVNEAIIVIEGETTARFLTGETLDLQPSECTFRTAEGRTSAAGPACDEPLDAYMTTVGMIRAAADDLIPEIQRRLGFRLPSPDSRSVKPSPN